MEIFKLTSDASYLVAELMAQIKPEYWDYNGALEQLTGYGIILLKDITHKI